MSILENTLRVREKIAEAAIRSGRKPEDILLVAASKMNDAERVKAAVKAGIDAAGENRVQEIKEKLPLGAYEGVPLHFIGHLQKNKVKDVVGVCDLIQSVDSPELIDLISKRAQKLEIVQDILIEVNIAGELQKSGIPPEKTDEILDLCSLSKGIRVRGLMTVPPVTDDPTKNMCFFERMTQLFIDMRTKKRDNVDMCLLSMGMSADYPEAILAGANMVRVGTAVFGHRDYGI